MSARETLSNVIRNSRGLSIAGTRITLYDIMDYVKQGWSAEMIQSWFDLSDEQITDVMAYIAANRTEVEAEYQLVLQIAEENRRYWEERNRDRLQKVSSTNLETASEEIRAKLRERKTRLGQE
jgi:uncharacterized protein (DUF433 family)